MNANELLAQLLAATPAPPATDDVDQLLAGAAAMFAAREALLVGVSATPAGVDPAKLAELAARTQAWQEVLAAAHRRVGEQRVGAGKLRHYATRL